jgi:hypothetical protein
MNRNRDPLELTVHVEGRPVNVELSRRNRAANPNGPRRDSIARIRLDPAAISAPMPGNFDSDGGGPVDQAWTAYSKAEADLMKALVNAAMPVIQARSDDGIIPATWALDRNAGCSICPCSPGLVGNTRITIDGHVVDLHITQRPESGTASSQAGPP